MGYLVPPPSPRPPKSIILRRCRYCLGTVREGIFNCPNCGAQEMEWVGGVDFAAGRDETVISKPPAMPQPDVSVGKK